MPLEMTITRLNPGCAVAAIDGSLTLGTNLKTLDGNVQQLIEAGVHKLVIDLAGCDYSDSAGLGFLVHTLGYIHRRGGAMRLCNVSARVMDLLTMTMTDAILPCDADRDASLAMLSCSAESTPT